MAILIAADLSNLRTRKIWKILKIRKNSYPQLSESSICGTSIGTRPWTIDGEQKLNYIALSTGNFHWKIVRLVWTFHEAACKLYDLHHHFIGISNAAVSNDNLVLTGRIRHRPARLDLAEGSYESCARLGTSSRPFANVARKTRFLNSGSSPRFYKILTRSLKWIFGHQFACAREFQTIEFSCVWRSWIGELAKLRHRIIRLKRNHDSENIGDFLWFEHESHFVDMHCILCSRRDMQAVDMTETAQRSAASCGSYSGFCETLCDCLVSRTS